MAASKASEAVFDIREDEEQYEKLQHCIDLLVAAGYFRARVKGISAFDKIVGGMVWCISTCNYSVDVDLHYAENLSIGQKISLTEKIVQVLPLLKCPHSIEPHQIQGFDFIHIFPVIQWLVKRACESREETGDDLKRYVDHLYNQRFPSKSPSSSLSSRLSSLSDEVGAPRRVFKRMDGVVTSSINKDILYTLAEYDHARMSSSTNESSSNDRESSEDIEGLQVAVSSSGRSKLSGRALKALVESGSMPEVTQAIMDQRSEQQKEKSIEDMKKRTEMIHEEIVEKKEKIEEKKRIDEEKVYQLNEKKERLDHYRTLHDQYTESEIDDLRRLLDEYNDSTGGETSFKRQCRDELEELDKEIEELNRRIDSGEDIEDEESLSILSSLERELDECRRENSLYAQSVSILQRKMDDIPTEGELAQYHKRFIELGNEILSEHRRLRQAFDEHNTMLDVRDYLKKENDLLNTVEDIVTKSQGDFRDSLTDKLLVVLKGLENTLDKLNHREEESVKEGDSLAKQLSDLREKERMYHNTIQNVKKEYDRNAQLRNELKKLGLEAISDI